MQNEPNNLKRLLALFMTLVLMTVLSLGTTGVTAFAETNAWDGTSSNQAWKGLGSNDDPYLITSAEDLAGLAIAVNDGEKFSGKFFKLTNDIDLNNKDWTPIGTRLTGADDGTINFSGNFDGDGHIVRNLNINSSTYKEHPYAATGLFSCVYNGAVIKKLGIENATITIRTDAYNSYSGALVGVGVNATIEDCYAKNVSISYGGNQLFGISGLVGFSDGIVKNCYVNKVAISSGIKNDCSGITPYPYGTIENCYAVNIAINGGANKYVTSPSGNNCYYANSVDYNSPNNMKKTEDELKKIAITLGTSFKDDLYGVNDGYPMLAWQNSMPGYYKIIINPTEKGTVSSEGASIIDVNGEKYCNAGASVIVNISPNEGAIIDNVSYNGISVEQKDGLYSFIMPSEDTTVVVDFLDVSDILNVISNINECKAFSDASGIKSIFDNNKKIINILSGELFTSISNDQTRLDMFYEKLAVQDKTDITKKSAIDDFSAQLEDVSFLILIKQNESANDVNELIEKVNIKKTIKGYNTYLSLDNKSNIEIIEKLSDADFLTFSDFENYFLLNSILTYIKSAVSPGAIKDVLTENKEILDIVSDIDKCEKLKKPENAYAVLCEREFSNMAEIKNAFIKAIDDAFSEESKKDNDNRRPSGGGGSGGGKSVGSITVITPQPSNSSISTNTAVASARFKDLSDVPWAIESIEKFAELGYVAGDGNGKFSPNDEIKREEFTKIFVLAMGIHYENQEANFSDVLPNDWYYHYVADAIKAGIVNGIGNDKFGAGEKITRQDMAVMVYRYLMPPKSKVNSENFLDEKDISDYAKEAVKRMKEYGIINGMEDNTFAPRAYLTKAQAVVILDRLLNIKEELE